MSDLRDFLENVVYHTGDRRRYTQQSPVMPDVWISYGMHPGEQLELLLVPDWHYTPAALAAALKERLDLNGARNKRLAKFRRSGKNFPPAVAHNQNTVVATLWFDELVREVLPLSRWWARSVAGIKARGDADKLVGRLSTRLKRQRLAEDLAKAMAGDGAGQIPSDVVWLGRVVGLLARLSQEDCRHLVAEEAVEGTARLKTLFESHEELAAVVVELLQGVEPVDGEDDFPLYTVNKNRRTKPSLYDSLAAVKADATRRVFGVGGEAIRWAVVDSGIDARHVAFRKRGENGAPQPDPFPKRSPRRRRRRGAQSASPQYRNDTRIVATYDFVHIRELLGVEPDDVDSLDRDKFPALKIENAREELKALLERSSSHAIDWERLDPFLRIPHEPEPYKPPANRHGTHVGGIIAADWRVKDDVPPSGGGGDLVGMAPSAELYDLRVLDEKGEGNEFAIMSALQFVRDLNNRKDFVAIHGVNLSFSIEHDVANYACGRTPVCEEAERLVGSGVTVVAAAGNSGRARYLTPMGYPDDGFRTVSITDPGNADSVITVGSTHRRDAHTYGVSYFSSRGPTGDGRLKPDLVAPGEKIVSTAPDNGEEQLDGTSMAAPHVSGAAALIMARHSELINQPRRVKEILCKTATDLGRERYFQGAGLLDILRALESI